MESISPERRGIIKAEVMELEEQSPFLRLHPERRLCAKFDQDSIAVFRVANRRCMGMRVVDNCAEEHMM